MSGHGNARVLVVGLDGASWRILEPLLRDGRVPHLAGLLERGGRAVLDSTMPPLTPPAWASFMTGMNPGKHGVLTFRALDYSRYSSFVERFATSESFAHLSIYRALSDAGLRVASVGVPMTYPPFPVNGVMISGTPKVLIEEDTTYPASLPEEVGTFTEKPPRLGRKDDFRGYMARYMDAFRNAARTLLEQEQWDLFCVVFSNTDWVVHQFWEYYDDTFPTYSPEGAKRYGEVIAEEYERADEGLGELLELSGPDTLVIIMSDHGAGPTGYRSVALNLWLAEQGLLARGEGGAKLAGRKARLLEQARLLTPTPVLDYARRFLPDRVKASISAGRLNIGDIRFGGTQAYRVPLMPMYDAVVLNIHGRQPEGIVDPGESDALRERLKADLQRLTDPENGSSLVARAWTRDELFSGPYIDDMPDVVIEYAEGYTGGAELERPLVRPVEEFFLKRDSGFHRQDGILVAAGSIVDAAALPELADITDIAPTILAALGQPIPADMDGRPLPGAVTEGWTLSEQGDERLDRRLDSIEQEDIRRSLESLGYF
jgi:predicted AlkP superfamily phosphohydrolase/phosphomutase